MKIQCLSLIPFFYVLPYEIVICPVCRLSLKPCAFTAHLERHASEKAKIDAQNKLKITKPTNTTNTAISAKNSSPVDDLVKAINASCSAASSPNISNKSSNSLMNNANNNSVVSPTLAAQILTVLQQTNTSETNLFKLFQGLAPNLPKDELQALIGSFLGSRNGSVPNYGVNSGQNSNFVPKNPNLSQNSSKESHSFNSDNPDDIPNHLKEFDPDIHCGVLLNEPQNKPSSQRNGQPCVRSLQCKSHSVAERRSVLGRSRKFDQLLADLKAGKRRKPKYEIGKIASNLVSENSILKTENFMPTIEKSTNQGDELLAETPSDMMPPPPKIIHSAPFLLPGVKKPAAIRPNISASLDIMERVKIFSTVYRTLSIGIQYFFYVFYC